MLSYRRMHRLVRLRKSGRLSNFVVFAWKNRLMLKTHYKFQFTQQFLLY